MRSESETGASLQASSQKQIRGMQQDEWPVILSRIFWF